MLRSVRIVKRVLDVVGAGAGLLLTAPLFPLLALAIRLDSPGPVFYRQRRAGRLRDDLDASRPPGSDPSFEEFDMFKFRSMVVDAERKTGAILATADDARITRVGRLLRRYRLDELPQFWNVLRGEMSLVGPRPERPELVVNLALAIPFFEERMRDIKPGITGYAQVSLGYSGRPLRDSALLGQLQQLVNPYGLDYGGDEVEVEADDMRVKLLYDLPYVAAMERFSSWAALELLILLRTPLVMLRGVGR
ncbi:MAG: sugar transferase [Proteobacteria bacterium]|nr:sugar transferase [Pseudomonadota bacterium]